MLKKLFVLFVIVMVMSAYNGTTKPDTIPDTRDFELGVVEEKIEIEKTEQEEAIEETDNSFSVSKSEKNTNEEVIHNKPTEQKSQNKVEQKKITSVTDEQKPIEEVKKEALPIENTQVVEDNTSQKVDLEEMRNSLGLFKTISECSDKGLEVSFEDVVNILSTYCESYAYGGELVGYKLFLKYSDHYEQYFNK